MLRCSLWVFLLFYLPEIRGTATSSLLDWSGTIVSGTLFKSVEAKYRKVLSLFEMDVQCSSNSTNFLTVTLTNPQLNQVLISSNSLCLEGEPAKQLSDPIILENDDIVLEIKGTAGTNFSVSLTQTQMSLDWTSSILLSKGKMVIRSFDVYSDDLTPQFDGHGFIRIGVESKDKFISSNSSSRNVAKLFVTKKYTLLKEFFQRKQYDYSELESMQMLSFSTFGAITLSNASLPVLEQGTWFIGLVQVSQSGSVTEMADKTVFLEKLVVKNYGYNFRILSLFLVSILGVVFPVLSRAVFDYNNFRKTGRTKLRAWLGVVMDWTWRGDKGYPYLMTLLMMVLSVGAFQVVNAKWSDMIKFGDRDICYYNEKCYRPYVNYDVSVNDCASNLPFAVHGIILVVYFSICEAYCKSVGHMYYDYSIPYSFGVTLICEAIGSFLYHICPSQIIFQFDTMFMFMISILQIIGIFEGYSVRKHDVIYMQSMVDARDSAPKSLQPSKVICYFVGPVYFFNFIGNWSQTQGIPLWTNVVFYISYSVWLLCILIWAAYNLGLLDKTFLPLPGKTTPAAPNNAMTLEHIFTPDSLNKITRRQRKIFTTLLFLIYCIISSVGSVFAFLHKIPFSIYLLGILIVASIGLTCITFVPLMHRLIVWVRKNNIGSVSCGGLRFWGSNQILMIAIMVGYVLVGCAFSAVSLVFFSTYETTDKSKAPWLSRELNAECYLDDFFSSHDIWHLLASFSLMIMILLNVQIGKPCRDCYLSYLTESQRESIRWMTVRWQNGEKPRIARNLLKVARRGNGNKNSDQESSVSNIADP